MRWSRNVSVEETGYDSTDEWSRKRNSYVIKNAFILFYLLAHINKSKAPLSRAASDAKSIFNTRRPISARIATDRFIKVYERSPVCSPTITQLTFIWISDDVWCHGCGVSVCSMSGLDVLGTTLLPSVHVQLCLQRPNVDDGFEPVSNSRWKVSQLRQCQWGLCYQQHAPS